MCGFFITNNPVINQEHHKLIEDSLRFRGPDCSSDLIEHRGWLAYHSRLSIIDINSGINQPVIDKKGGLLVFNGEILNYKKLGFKYFDTEFVSDTSLLSELLSSEQLLLDELDGFFAFVYIDSQGELKSAARDRFGVKPLFIHKDGQHISFSSEPNTFKKLFTTTVNPIAIEEYRATRSPIFSGSYFNEVDIVSPGYCYVSGEYFDCLTYLNGEYTSVNKEELKESLLKGLKTREISDAPLGLLLSRGIDSNLLKELGDFNKFYTIGFSGDEDIEYLKSEQIDNLTVSECTAAEYKEHFNYLLKLRGEPMSVPNEVLLYKISKEAANDGIKVLLSGEGADEFFAGYDRIFKWAATVNEFNFDTFIQMYCYIAPDKSSDLYKCFYELFAGKVFYSPFETVRWFFIRYHMPVLFRRLDFALMAAGIEGREPIANHHVFELAAKISPKALIGDVLGKLPLRDLICDFKGESFAYEKKVGFPVDLTKVFDNPNNLSSYDLWFEQNLEVLK